MAKSKKISPLANKLIKIAVSLLLSLGLGSLGLKNTELGNSVSNTVIQVTDALLSSNSSDSIVSHNDTTANVTAVHNVTQ